MRDIIRSAGGGKIEYRTDTAANTVSIAGYAAVFDQAAHGEVIRSTAFDRAIRSNADVKLLLNHEGLPLASTGAGTMSMRVDDHGLYIEAPDLDLANPRVQELVSVLSRGDATKMSFAFSPLGETKDSNGTREISDLFLFEVSAAVAFPWYEGTNLELNSRPVVSVRSRFDHRGSPMGAMSFGDIAAMVSDAIEDRIETLTGMDEVWVWLDDLGPDWAVYCLGSDYWQIPYSVAGDVVALGEPFEVLRQVVYVPDVEPVTADPSARTRLVEARALLGLEAA